jgi:hypothetical protein
MSESFPGSGYFNGERLRRVTFLVQSGANGNNEMLLQQNSMFAAAADESQGVYSLVLARDVTFFQLEFYHKQVTRGEWQSEWLSTNQLPQLVRVNLGLGHSSINPRVPDQLVSRIVALPAVGTVP